MAWPYCFFSHDWTKTSRVEDYPYHYVGSRLIWMVYNVHLREMGHYGTSRSINCFFKAFLNVLFPLVNLKQIGKWFQMVPPWKYQTWFKQISSRHGKRAVYAFNLFGFVVNVLMIFFGAVPFYLFIYLLEADSPVNTAGSPQGFSLN